MRYISILLLAFIFYSCGNEKPFINHKLAFEKSGDCSPGEKTVNMLSNIAGERYEFEACLSADFDGKDYTVERTGDSIVVNLKRHGGEMKAFKITLDIDAFPVYNFIVIDHHEAIPIKHEGNTQ